MAKVVLGPRGFRSHTQLPLGARGVKGRWTLLDLALSPIASQDGARGRSQNSRKKIAVELPSDLPGMGLSFDVNQGTRSHRPLSSYGCFNGRGIVRGRLRRGRISIMRHGLTQRLGGNGRG